MFLYTDCYTNAGYAPMRMELADGRAEAFGKSRMEEELPPAVAALLTCGGFRLFAGRVEERYLLRISQIPTRLRDENRRRCYINLAFESTDREPVSGLLALVLGDYARFAQTANRMIVYHPDGYEIDRSVLDALLREARTAGDPLPDDRLILTPDAGGKEAFLNELPVYRARKIELRQLAAIDEEKLPDPVRRDERTMKLHLYFSTPAGGYAFVCTDAGTGATLAGGRQAEEMLDSRIADMVTTAGMRMALFRAGGKMNLVVKNISTDGGNQRMALVIQDGEETLARALAACALYRNRELCSAVTACVRIDEAQGTGSVDAQAVRALLDWALETQAPQGRRAEFDRIKRSGSFAGVPYVVLVVDPTLEYFVQMMRMQVKRSMVGMLMDVRAYEALSEDAAKKPEDAQNMAKQRKFPAAAAGILGTLILALALVIGSMAVRKEAAAPVQVQALMPAAQESAE